MHFCSSALFHFHYFSVSTQQVSVQCLAHLTALLWLQGAFMAALYSQGLAWEQMHHLVREYARQMSSVQHLLWDLTLPIMSVFNGVGFDRVVRETFKHGAQQIEDLWLRWEQWLTVAGNTRDCRQKRCDISSRKTFLSCLASICLLSFNLCLFRQSSMLSLHACLFVWGLGLSKPMV